MKRRTILTQSALAASVFFLPDPILQKVINGVKNPVKVLSHDDLFKLFRNPETKYWPFVR